MGVTQEPQTVDQYIADLTAPQKVYTITVPFKDTRTSCIDSDSVRCFRSANDLLYKLKITDKTHSFDEICLKLGGAVVCSFKKVAGHKDDVWIPENVCFGCRRSALMPSMFYWHSMVFEFRFGDSTKDVEVTLECESEPFLQTEKDFLHNNRIHRVMGMVTDKMECSLLYKEGMISIHNPAIFFSENGFRRVSEEVTTTRTYAYDTATYNFHLEGDICHMDALTQIELIVDKSKHLKVEKAFLYMGPHKLGEFKKENDGRFWSLHDIFITNPIYLCLAKQTPLKVVVQNHDQIADKSAKIEVRYSAAVMVPSTKFELLKFSRYPKGIVATTLGPHCYLRYEDNGIIVHDFVNDVDASKK